jgi:hypothetical protein
VILLRLRPFSPQPRGERATSAAQAMRKLNEMGCDELAGVAAELGFGVLTDRGRAEALAHLDRCAACRESVRQLTMTGEAFLDLQ